MTLNPDTTVSVDENLTGVTTGLNNINLLQPTAFKLVVDRKNYANLEFFCQSVAHPAIDVSATAVPIPRLGNVSMAGDKLNFAELECMIIVDENLNAYTEMYNWVHRIVQKADKTRLDRSLSDTTPPTYSDITLAILSSHNNTTRKIRYIDCIPTAIGTMQMEATAGDTTQIVFPVTFRFSYFELD